MSDQATLQPPTQTGPAPEREELEQPPGGAQSELVLDELLVEDISIDGMCGVY